MKHCYHQAPLPPTAARKYASNVFSKDLECTVPGLVPKKRLMSSFRCIIHHPPRCCKEEWTFSPKCANISHKLILLYSAKHISTPMRALQCVSHLATCSRIMWRRKYILCPRFSIQWFSETEPLNARLMFSLCILSCHYSSQSPFITSVCADIIDQREGKARTAGQRGSFSQLQRSWRFSRSTGY